MKRYPADDEQRIRLQGMVREWTRSGLLDDAQGVALAGDLRVEWRRTNAYLRAGLACFTYLIVGAAVMLPIVGLDLDDGVTIAAVQTVNALICFAMAEGAIARFRCYRFGVEEVLAVAAVVLLAVSASMLAQQLESGLPDVAAVAGLTIGAAGAFGLYYRFGYLYAACGAAACAAAIPFQLALSSPMQRLLAAVVVSLVFVIARSKRRALGDEFPGDDFGLLQAAALGGVYLLVNVQLLGNQWVPLDGVIYWSSYVLVWILPVVTLVMGLREKDRPLIDAGLAMTLATLFTNKAYLGWTANSWDPIVLGAGLIAIALAARRWLAAGPGAERRGFTATRLLDKERQGLSVAVAAAFVMHSDAPHQPAAPEASPFDGGRSGGAGGGGNF